MSVLKPFRRPRLWLGLWAAALLAVIVVCLVPPPPLQLPQHSDKLEHLLAYAILAAGAVQLFPRGRGLWMAGGGLVLMGVLLEFAQGALTSTRMADPADALANTVGVVLGLSTALTPWRDALLKVEGGDG